MQSKYKHVIWDWNGTLFDDAELCWQIINEIVLENNLPKVLFEKYLEVFTFPVKDYYAALGLPVENGEFERLGKIFIERYEERKFDAELHDGAIDFVKKINGCGIGQSVLSAYSLDKLISILKHFGLLPYMEEIAGLDNIYAHGKIEVGKRLMKKLALPRGEAVMIGDTLHDAEVAVEIGADIILIANGHQSEERLRKRGLPVVKSYSELEEIICQK